MRVAALYDIHANLPALEAVLRDVEAAEPDRIVIGSDAATDAMNAQTLDVLLALGERPPTSPTPNAPPSRSPRPLPG